MFIPNKVKIGGHEIEVNAVKDLETDIEVNGKTEYRELHGSANFVEQYININTNLSQTQAECTFIHELLHIIDDYMRIGLEEEQIDAMANGLYAVLKENTNLYKKNGGWK